MRRGDIPARPRGPYRLFTADMEESLDRKEMSAGDRMAAMRTALSFQRTRMAADRTLMAFRGRPCP